MSPYGFMPHGFCFEWRPGVLWLHVLSDLGIALSYYGIGSLLYYFVRQRRELPFKLLFWLFAAFITLCGTTHLVAIWVLWHPDYYFEGAMKAVTAVTSIGTLITLWFVLPRVLQAALSLEALVTSRSRELVEANAELRRQVAAREKIESALRQSQKMESLGQLTGGIAHDFNNMLQAIGGSLELMQESIESGKVTDAGHYMDNAHKTVARAASLTNRLLAFARRQPLQPRAVDPTVLITGMEQLIVHTVSAAIKVELALNAGDWSVLCDPNQLESALLNIAINARDAMPEGGVLTIGTKQQFFSAEQLIHDEGAEAGQYLEIFIADTGLGMDEAALQHAFEPFFTTKPIGQGTGLGLSQVYGFVRQSGGFARLKSAPAQGTTVRLFLRRFSGAPKALQPQAVADAVPARLPGAASILLVEDEPLVREITADYLRALGYQVLEAGDGQEALDLLAQTSAVDMLVTDVGLPNGLNGRQVADAARSMFQTLPVLFITGYMASTDLDRLDPGMQILGKPFNLAALAGRIKSVLEQRLPI